MDALSITARVEDRLEEMEWTPGHCDSCDRDREQVHDVTCIDCYADALHNGLAMEARLERRRREGC